MSQNPFAPNLSSDSKEPLANPVPHDSMSAVLLKATRIVLVVFIFLLPLFFLPGLWATLGFQKVLLALGATCVSTVALSLLMLRQNRLASVVPFAWLSFLGFVFVAGVSALFSNSPGDAFRGSVLEIDTVAFLLVLAGVMTLPLVLQRSKKYTMRALEAFLVSSAVLLFYVVIRFFLGPVFPLDSFGSVVSSPLGGFNDLAIFAGLSILVSLMTMLLLPLRMVFQGILAVVTVLSLIVLATVNFFFVWLIVGFFGLLMLLYIVSRDRLFVEVEKTAIDDSSPGWILTALTVLVCAASAWFIIMGDAASTQVSRMFGIEYLEVRPSLSATVDIVRNVYADDLLLGTGPNQFISAWRQFKDPSINNTLFWSVDFGSGSGYLTTIAATTGVLGLIAFLIFQVSYLWYGVRLLFHAKDTDVFWYFVAAVSFVASVFLWLLSYLYVPGHTVLLLAALFTGISFAAGATVTPERVKSIPLVTNRQRGFGLMAVAILLITGSVGVLLMVGEQYVAHATFNSSQATATDIAVIDQAAAVAYEQYQDDTFLGVRSRIALLEMEQLLQLPEPSEGDQRQFLDVSERAIALANLAIENSPENPQHHAVLANVFNNLALAGVDGALARATSSLATAESIDPLNPVYALLEAQMAARRGDAGSARQALQVALSKKRNYTEALYLLAQIDIAEGDTDAAIQTTLSIISLEPNNPTRYYQLGILLTAANRGEEAVLAYGRALEIDPQYANARYLRALQVAQAGQTETALSELKLVQASNPENEQLAAVISQLEEGVEFQAPASDAVEIPVGEQAPQQDADTVTSPVAPDTDLLTPLNPVPDQSEDEVADVEPAEEPLNESEGDTTQ